MEDPSLWRALWVSRTDEYLALVNKRLFFARQEAAAADHLPRTKRRLEQVIAGLESQRVKIASILRPLGNDVALHIPSRPEVRDNLALLECYEHIFRDWAWGSDEVDRLRALIERSLPEGLDAVAIYGAGAGRLAVDLHRSRRTKQTFALDLNPLPFLVADALVRGEAVELPEFPLAPNSGDDVVAHHRLFCPDDVGAGLHWVFADALRPPFAPGSLDAVLTSWFIDVAAADVRVIAAAIHRVLRPGGLWLNVGPLRFRGELSRQYSIEEVHDLVGSGSFTLTSTGRHDLPYFDSPRSGARRVDTVFSFSAAKTGEARPQPVPRSVAPWITDARLPIPVTGPLIALGKTSVFTASMLELIDGTRTMADLADALGRSWNVAPVAVLDQLRAFFAKLPE